MISHWLEWVELQAFASFASFVCSPVRWWPDTVHAHYIVQWRTCKRQHHQHQRDSHVFCGVYININTYCRAIRTPSLQIANERWQSVRISQQIVHYTYAARLFMHFYLQICMILFFLVLLLNFLLGTHILSKAQTDECIIVCGCARECLIENPFRSREGYDSTAAAHTNFYWRNVTLYRERKALWTEHDGHVRWRERRTHIFARLIRIICANARWIRTSHTHTDRENDWIRLKINKNDNVFI